MNGQGKKTKLRSISRTPSWSLLWWAAVSLVALAINVTGALPAQADPLTPLTPAELQYLDKLHAVFAVSRDNAAFRSDGELLDSGRYVCRLRSDGVVGYEGTHISPAIAQLAFIYLCPS